MFAIVLNKLVDCIFPKICVTCKELVLENDTLCHKCWKKLQFISKPYCPKCSIPWDFYEYHSLEVCRCVLENHVYRNIHSVVKYNKMAKDLVLKLKFNSDFRIAKFIGKLIQHQFTDLFYKVDFICPVPLSINKIKKREFNQCALILKHINGIRNKLILDLLVKIKDTQSQSSLSKNQRRSNLKNAFEVNSKYLNNKMIYNKKIGIFDDIVTTASTVNECSKALLKGGASEVTVFSFARA